MDVIQKEGVSKIHKKGVGKIQKERVGKIHKRGWVNSGRGGG